LVTRKPPRCSAVPTAACGDIRYLDEMPVPIGPLPQSLSQRQALHQAQMKSVEPVQTLVTGRKLVLNSCHRSDSLGIESVGTTSGNGWKCTFSYEGCNGGARITQGKSGKCSRLRDRAKINSVIMAQEFSPLARRKRRAYPASGSVRSEQRSQWAKGQARIAEVVFARSLSWTQAFLRSNF
jgi:hypothetical protein